MARSFVTLWRRRIQSLGEWPFLLAGDRRFPRVRMAVGWKVFATASGGDAATNTAGRGIEHRIVEVATSGGRTDVSAGVHRWGRRAPLGAAGSAVGSTAYCEPMSKVTAMQALREARYAGARASRPTTVPPAASAPPAAGTRPADLPLGESPSLDAAHRFGGGPESAAVPLLQVVAEPAAEEVLCGHRSMNNRSCRRPAGHPEKNHRYH